VVSDSAADLYVAAFLARHNRESNGRQHTLAEPGISGLISAEKEPPIHLLAIDDRGYGRLVAEVEAPGRGVVAVFDRASRCEEFMRSQIGWWADRPTTGMSLCDLRAIPEAALPDGLVLRHVKTLANEEPDAVPLEDAVAVAFASDPGVTDPPAQFARFLKGLPSSVQLLAAVDGAGVARATSGCDVFGDFARVFFVNTEPDWRRQGIGRTMTIRALQAAASSGARRIVLDATDAGASLYAALGFKVAGRLTRYRRP
jgi:ribosomal protein S18 acetylase RimI-like enzyme